MTAAPVTSEGHGMQPDIKGWLRHATTVVFLEKLYPHCLTMRSRQTTHTEGHPTKFPAALSARVMKNGAAEEPSQTRDQKQDRGAEKTLVE